MPFTGTATVPILLDRYSAAMLRASALNRGIVEAKPGNPMLRRCKLYRLGKSARIPGFPTLFRTQAPVGTATDPRFLSVEFTLARQILPQAVRSFCISL